MSKTAMRTAKTQTNPTPVATAQQSNPRMPEFLRNAGKADNAPRRSGAAVPTNTAGDPGSEQLDRIERLLQQDHQTFKQRFDACEEQLMDVGRQLRGFDHRCHNAEQRLARLEAEVFPEDDEEDQPTQPATRQPRIRIVSEETTPTQPQPSGTATPAQPRRTAPLGQRVNMIDFATPVTYWAPWDARNCCWGTPLKSVFAAEAAGYGEPPKKVFIWVDRETSKAYRPLTAEELALYTEHATFAS